ncbi:MAG: DUF1844 domain-containing protein [Capsulimonadales bacterium]|nr:DUF1844 domain-containing protein [Capsulimonadales bacterium]
MADDPEEGFVIRDRRRFTSELNAGPAAAPTDSPAAPEATPPPAEEIPSSLLVEETFAEEAYDSEDMGNDNSVPDVYSVLILFLGEMRNHALLRMGLVHNPMTGQIERDLQQARIAINTATFLAEQLEPVLPQEERLPLRAMLSDLQMNFVKLARGAE